MFDFIKILGCAVYKTIIDSFKDDRYYIVYVCLAVLISSCLPFMASIISTIIFVLLIKESDITFKENWDLYIPAIFFILVSTGLSILYFTTTVLTLSFGLSEAFPFCLAIISIFLLSFILGGITSLLKLFVLNITKNFESCKKEYKEIKNENH